MPLPNDTAEPASEAFYLDEAGNRRDEWIHEELLDNPEAERQSRISAARSALERGKSREWVLRTFGVLPPEGE